MQRPGALDLDDLLNDVVVPSSTVPDFDFSEDPNKNNISVDLFEEKQRAGWSHEIEPRCDFSPNKVRISFRNPAFGIISLWKRSIYGKTLTEIKEDPDMVPFFIKGMVTLIKKMIGENLSQADWCIVTSPKRRHKVRNFSSLISAGIAKEFNIPFYEDLAVCKNRQRVGAVFHLSMDPPKERNIIIFDDFVTSGSTMISMRELLYPLGYNLVFLTGINNKL